MARRKSEAPPRNDFEVPMVIKELDSKYLANRWSKTERRIDQLRESPKQLHIDAISGIPSRRKRTAVYEQADIDIAFEFETTMTEKRISPEFLAERWGLTVRRINQIRKSPELMHLDAMRGIPKYRKRTESSEEGI